MASQRTATESGSGSVDERLIEALFEEGEHRFEGGQSFAETTLRRILDDPACDGEAAVQMASYLERFTNPHFAREIIEHGIAAENPEVQRVFADRVGWLAALEYPWGNDGWKDAYAVIGKLAKTEVAANPDDDLLVVALRAVRRDASDTAFDNIVERGTREQRDPQKQKRAAPFQRRLREALSELGE